MDKEQQNLVILSNKYRDEVMRLAQYLPWLEAHVDHSVSSNYDANGEMSTSLAFPVYDGNLLRMVKEAKNTQFVDKNYVYVYSRKRMRSVADEKRAIEQATMAEFDVLAAILAKYVLTGMTKGKVWSEGVTSGVFYQVISKMKELVEFWGQK